MTAFRRGDYICLVDRGELEPFERFLDRGNFIVSQYPQSSEEYNKVVLFSRIYINSKYLGCMYDGIVMGELNKMIEKMNQSDLGK